LTLWDDIRTWIEGHVKFVFPEVNIGMPANK